MGGITQKSWYLVELTDSCFLKNQPKLIRRRSTMKFLIIILSKFIPKSMVEYQ